MVGHGIFSPRNCQGIISIRLIRPKNAMAIFAPKESKAGADYGEKRMFPVMIVGTIIRFDTGQRNIPGIQHALGTHLCQAKSFFIIQGNIGSMNHYSQINVTITMPPHPFSMAAYAKSCVHSS